MRHGPSFRPTDPVLRLWACCVGLNLGCGGQSSGPTHHDGAADVASPGDAEDGGHRDASCGPRDASVQPFDVAPNPDAGECGCVLGFDFDADGGLEVVCCDPGQRCCGHERNCDDEATCPLGWDWGIWCAEWDWCSSDGCRCREHCCTCTAADCGSNRSCLVSRSDNLTLAECERCQGAPCGSDAECDERFPCSGGSIEIRGCCEDSECAGLAPYCGQANGAHNVCVRNDCN